MAEAKKKQETKKTQPAKKEATEPTTVAKSTPRKPTVREAIQTTCGKLQATLLAKNTQYGNSAFTPPQFVCATAEEGIATRFGDKIKRLEQLVWDKPTKDNSAIDDTLLDIAGYAVLWLAERRRNRT